MNAPYRGSEEQSGGERSLAMSLTQKRALAHVPRVVGQAWFIVLLPILVAMTAPLAALALAACGVAWIVFDTRRRLRGDMIHMSVQATSLTVRVGGGSTLEAPLSDVLDVRLDSKVVHQSVGQRADGINAAIASGPTMASDASRVELVLSDRTLILCEEHTSHGLALESLRAIRLFLRRNGWIPEDERAAEEPEPEPRKKETEEDTRTQVTTSHRARGARAAALKDASALCARPKRGLI